MIKAVHTLIYSDDPEATRAFLRDILRWPSVEDPDSGPDWPIFKTGPSEMGVHPTAGTWEGQPYSQPKHHSISLMCDDIEATKAELEGRGAEFTGGVEDYGFGSGAMLKLPGADDVLLYQPRHPRLTASERNVKRTDSTSRPYAMWSRSHDTMTTWKSASGN